MSTTDRTATCVTRESSGRALALTVALVALLAACEGDRGPAGPPGTGGGGGNPDPDGPTDTTYALGDSVPELRLHIDGLGGASGPAGEFLPGDTLSVDFTLEKESGEAWTMAELIEGQALVSGPSFNYQRVLPAVSVLASATQNSPGHFTFRFADPLPATYAPPYNDTQSFGAVDGELTGVALRDGTYTLGLSFTWNFTVDGRPFRRVGEAALDFALGTGAGPLAPRAVTAAANCNRCHGELEAHDGRYRTLALCLLCHTAGAEDANDPAIAGGTPAVTIDSRVLFHKLHTGRFLASVNGISTSASGARIYNALPVPLRYARPDGVVRDFSHVGFPAMPNRIQPMPRDIGYTSLPPNQQHLEDLQRSGPSDCALCHGDPDGAGPIVAPPQGTLINTSSRKACGACHDDVVFSRNYRSNNNVMPPQNNDSQCFFCHDPRFPGPLSPIDAHQSPLHQADFNPGLHVSFTALAEAGPNDADGTLDPGEGVALEFSVTNDVGAAVAPSSLDELRVLIAGPNSNFQVLYDAAVPKALVTGVAPFQLVLPERVQLELLGHSTAALDAFQTQRFPLRLASGATFDLLVRTGTSGGATTLRRAAGAPQNFIDVFDATGFARGDTLVIDDGDALKEEYLRVQFVDGRRLWFSAPNQPSFPPGLRFAHLAGASVREVQTAPVPSAQFTLDAANGIVGELSELGDGNALLASYTTDYRVPATYPQALNGSGERNDLHGKWSGHTLVSGTYVASLGVVKGFDYRFGNAVTHYNASSPAATRSFLVGDALEPEPYTRIPDGESCNTCHQELAYHDGTYRGFETCILCHGASGTEDLPRYVAANAPATPGLSVEFRTLLHRIHTGAKAADASYQVVIPGPAPYPDNFQLASYHDFSTLPAYPDRTLECGRCHGEERGVAILPDEREHPTQQALPLQIWRPACLGCHDSEAARAHIDSNTAPNGAEACSICHAPGEFEDVERAHLGHKEPR